MALYVLEFLFQVVNQNIRKHVELIRHFCEMQDLFKAASEIIGREIISFPD